MDVKEYQKTLMEAQKPLLVEFWAPWCAPCRMMAPALERVAEQNANEVDLLRINADESQEVLRALRVYSIPTMIGYDGTVEQFRRSGALPEPALNDLFAALAQRQPPPKASLQISQRLVRLGLGGMVALMGVLSNAWWVVLLGGVLAFTGVYDRCPIYAAVSQAVGNAIQRRRQSPKVSEEPSSAEST